MSKELEALKRLTVDKYANFLRRNEDITVIEQALKDKEKKDKAIEIMKEIDKTSLLHFIAVSVKDQEKYEFLKEELEK